MLLSLLHKRKYEVLLVVLILHLFGGIVINSIFLYTAILWPVNMLLVGLAGFGVVVQKGRWKTIVRNLLFLPVILLPLGAHYYRSHTIYFFALSMAFIIFFIFIFQEVILFLIRPGYINADMISAAACGYFLLVETATFICQLFFYHNPASFKGVDAAHHTTIYNDFVYFSSVTITSIGFGDIVPASSHTKLLTAFLGISGQFYSVVLMGIVISKFVSRPVDK